MDWKFKIQNECDRLNIESIMDKDKKITFLCPKIPEESSKTKLISILPSEFSYEFMESPKIATVTSLIGLCMNFGISPRVPEVKGKHITLSSVSQNPDINEDHDVWNALNKVLVDDGFFESWTIEINGMKRTSYLSVLTEKREKRDYGITDDDITNLHIALNQDITFDEFLAQI